MYFVIPDEDVDTINELNTVIDEIKESTSGLECEVSVGSEESSTSFLASGVSVNIYGDDRDALYEIGDDIINILEGVNGLTNVSNGLEDADQAVHLSIDKDKAAKKGLNVATIYGKISEQLTTKKEAATLTLDGNKVTISIIDETDKLEYENLMDLELEVDRKSTRLNSSQEIPSRMPSSA